MTAQTRAILFKKIRPFKGNPFKVDLPEIHPFKSNFFKTKLFKVLLAAVLVIAGLALITVSAFAGTTFTINSTDDDVDAGGCQPLPDGDCTLREAIQQANTTANNPLGIPDVINFDIATGTTTVKTISPRTALPAITEAVYIDGYTQGDSTPDTADDATENTKTVGNDAQLKIELSGNGAGSSAIGLSITGPGSTVRGLSINRWGVHGVDIGSATATNNKVEGNFIGTNADGTQAAGNLRGVVTGSGSSGSTVGGMTPDKRNVISGNSLTGISIAQTNNNVVQNNYFGTNKQGSGALPNGFYGVEVFQGAQNNAIGGAEAGAGNVVSGNGIHGVRFSDSGTVNNTVQGNYIGTDALGAARLANAQDGVRVEGGSKNNTVGGTTTEARNVISGNNARGFAISGAGASGNTAQGNYIGTNKDGARPAGAPDLGNSQSGVAIDGAPNNTIGGTTTGARNVISDNNQDGIFINGSGASGNQVQGNYVGTNATGNTALGNSRIGVYILDAPTNTIGGTAEGARNVISGNGDKGIYVYFAGFPAASTAGGNQVKGNYIGTDATGTKVFDASGRRLGNGFSGSGTAGVYINNAPNSTIGGVEAGAGNVISGNNNSGVFIHNPLSSGNKVQGNYVGTNASGTAALANGEGVLISNASNNLVGGTVEGARNVISGNNQNGVVITPNTAHGNQVKGNYIGTDATGTADLGNSFNGVYVYGERDNLIGGTEVGARNVVSGNNNDGVLVVTYPASSSKVGTKVQGNYIGTKANGTDALGNSQAGVHLSGGRNNFVGGTEAGASNVIAFNTGDGVRGSGFTSGGGGTGHAILSNSTFSNGGTSTSGLGIDLDPGSVTPNDDKDPDTGPNNLQNFPVLSEATNSGGTTNIEGTLNSTPNTTFTVQFFSNPEKDPSGNGEGKTYIGQKTDVTTDGSGNISFTFDTPDASSGEFVTATATSSGNDTSEFSGATEVVPANTPPVASDPTVTISEDDTGELITLTANDDDNDDLAYKITALPTNGKLYDGADTNGSEITSTSTDAPYEMTGNQVTYVPDADYNGTDSFKFVANDGTDDSNEATASITVNAVNDAPGFDLPTDPNQKVQEDAGAQTVRAFATNISAGPANESRQTVSFRVANDNNRLFTTEGQPEIDPETGDLTYEPEADANGKATVTVTADDGENTSAERTFTIEVPAVNDAPEAVVDSYTTDEDTELTVATADGILKNDTDIENDSLTAVKVSDPVNGTLMLGSDGSFAYVPKKDFEGTDSFTYEANDGADASGAATVMIAVAPVNDAPVAKDDEATTDEDTATSGINVLANDSDVEGDTLSVASFTQPSRGQVTENSDGTLRYAPEKDYNGSDSFEYTVNDGTLDGDQATVSITVNPVNDAPVAEDDTKATPENTPLVFPASDLTANDSEGPGNEADQTLTVTDVGEATRDGSTVSLDSEGRITFTPKTDYNGEASFKYTVCDNGSPQECSTQTATVDVTVSAVNSKPVANDGAETINEDGDPITVDPASLVSDTETSDANLTYTIVREPVSEKGTLAQSGPSTFVFDPAEHFNGEASFTYTVTDRGDPDNCGAASSSCAAAETSEEKTVTITVNPVNDAPVADDKTITINEDTPKDVTLAATDADGDALAYTVVSNPEHGALSGSGTNLTYTPEGNYAGPDAFTYKASDGAADSNVATVSITVAAVNDAPVAKDDAAETDEGTAQNVDVLANDSDVEDDALSVESFTRPSRGTVTKNSDGTLKYTPENGYQGPDFFEYTVSDGNGGTDTAAVTITVNGPNDVTRPTVECGAADGLWHKDDVDIECTASDGGSGLANPDDARFSLSTNVPAGTETDDASTGSREVCDNADNCATAGPISGNKVDKKAPTITINTPDKDGAEYKLNQAVASSFECNDGGSGKDSCAGPNTLDTSSVGQKTFTATTTDKVGNEASASRSYRVVYDFKGFFSPVDNLPALNLWKAGLPVPVRFSLGGDQGRDIFAAGYPKSQQIDCVLTAPSGSEQSTVSADPSVPRYVGNLGQTRVDQYLYPWTTSRTWAGSCRQLIVKLKDGTEHKANFKFKQ